MVFFKWRAPDPWRAWSEHSSFSSPDPQQRTSPVVDGTAEAGTPSSVNTSKKELCLQSPSASRSQSSSLSLSRNTADAVKDWRSLADDCAGHLHRFLFLRRPASANTWRSTEARSIAVDRGFSTDGLPSSAGGFHSTVELASGS